MGLKPSHDSPAVYIKVPIAAVRDGVAVDLSTEATCQLAILEDATDPTSNDWENGEWEVDPDQPDSYYARILAGTGTEARFPLYEPETYVHVRVSLPPEELITFAGILDVT